MGIEKSGTGLMEYFVVMYFVNVSDVSDENYFLKHKYIY